VRDEARDTAEFESRAIQQDRGARRRVPRRGALPSKAGRYGKPLRS
jgi:hypothetical protein